MFRKNSFMFQKTLLCKKKNKNDRMQMKWSEILKIVNQKMLILNKKTTVLNF